MKVNGFWVYTVTCPDGMVYVGMSMRENTSMRWNKQNYESCSLYPYIELWGWKNLKKEVIKEGLTKEEAFDLEEELISFCELNGVCINKRHSGGVTLNGNGVRDLNTYNVNKAKENGYKHQHKYFESHREEQRTRCLNNYYKKKWAKQLTELGYIPLF